MRRPPAVLSTVSAFLVPVVVLLLMAGCAAAHRPVAAGVPSASGSSGAGAAGRPGAAATGAAANAPFAIPSFPPRPAPAPITLPAAGPVPFLSRISTTQPIAFLTIDDGFTRTAEAPKLIAAAHIPVTLFLTSEAAQADPGYFRPMLRDGAVVEAHTITHTELRGKSYGFQKHEICGSADKLARWYGRRPVLFRPPFGTRDATTMRAARDCGMRAVFMWKETVDKGRVRYQEGHTVRRGDIILMHFRPAFVADFTAALRAIHRAGLTPALLEDYIPA